MDKPVPTIGMNLRRGGAKLRSIGKAHSPLHVLLWQSKETQRTLSAAAAAQVMLYNDVATWAASENRALRDVCSNAAELNDLAASAQLQLSLAYKAFRKDMNLILEGERRQDAAQKVFQDAENRRVKLKKQYNHAKDRPPCNANSETPKRSVDLAALRTQLAEAERTADRAHMTVTEACREQEAVKLVVIRAALAKLSQAHLNLAAQSKTIFEAVREVSHQIPDPPPPDNHLGVTQYNGCDVTRGVLERVKGQVQAAQQRSPTGQGPQFYSTPITSPTSGSQISNPNWASASPQPPSAPNVSIDSNGYSPMDPPPPYNLSYMSPSPRDMSGRRSRNNSQISTRAPSGQGRRSRSRILNSSAISPSSVNHVSTNQQSFHTPNGHREDHDNEVEENERSTNRNSNRRSPRY